MSIAQNHKQTQLRYKKVAKCHFDRMMTLSFKFKQHAPASQEVYVSTLSCENCLCPFRLSCKRYCMLIYFCFCSAPRSEYTRRQHAAICNLILNPTAHSHNKSIYDEFAPTFCSSRRCAALIKLNIFIYFILFGHKVISFD